MKYNKYKVPFPVSSLPSGGIVNPGFENYNPKNYYVELEGLSFGKVIEFENAKLKAKNKLEKLAVEIDYLIPNSLLNFPVCDMYAIMTNVSILSGFDIIGDEKQKSLAEAKGESYENKPYFLHKIICPSCKKEIERVSFNLHQISFLKWNNYILEGKLKWKDYIQFDNNIENYLFKFNIPLIKDLRAAIDEFNEIPEYFEIEYPIALKLILLAISLELVEENSKKSFKDKFHDMKELFEFVTGGDAMKLEILYNEILIPPVLLKKVCDCKGASSVYDMSNIITDVLRLLISNSGRVTQYIYEFSEKMESGYNSDEFQISNRSSSSLYDEIRKSIKSENKES